MNRSLCFPDLIERLEKAYTDIRKKGYHNWRGPLITNNQMLCTSENINAQFNKKHVKWQKEENNHSDLYIILHAAIQLGIQQGIYLVNENPFSYLETEDIDEFLYKVRYIKAHK